MKSKLLLGLALVICTGTATAQTATTGIPVVRDANGQIIGPVVNFVAPPASPFESLHTVIFARDIPVYIGVNSEGGFFTPGIFFQVFFESLDCSGTPYLGESVPGDFDRVLNVSAFREVLPEGLEAYVPAEGATLQIGVLRQSSLQSDGACISFPGGSNVDGIPAARFQTPFVGPASEGQGPTLAQAGFSIAVPYLGPAGTTLLVILVALLTLGTLRQQRER